MNTEMAYLIGMILGNGEIQQHNSDTTITINIPYKNLKSDDSKDVAVYVKASLLDIIGIIKGLTGSHITVSDLKHSTNISFTKSNEDYLTRELIRYVGAGRRHSTMSMNSELFSFSTDEKKSLLKGIADVTAYIRKSNCAFGDGYSHRVYIEIPGNWQMVIDVANMLKTLDIPVHNIDFGHPNFRDAKLKKYNEGNSSFWKKEHQIKIYANEFLPIGFNILHKQQTLEKYATILLKHLTPEKTHRFYWEKPYNTKIKPSHPCENDPSLPPEIRGMHFDSWTELAKALGYGK